MDVSMMLAAAIMAMALASEGGAGSPGGDSRLGGMQNPGPMVLKLDISGDGNVDVISDYSEVDSGSSCDHDGCPRSIEITVPGDDPIVAFDGLAYEIGVIPGYEGQPPFLTLDMAQIEMHRLGMNHAGCARDAISCRSKWRWDEGSGALVPVLREQDVQAQGD